MIEKQKGIILCVDDEAIVLNSLRDQLHRAYGRQYIIELAESADEGLEILDELSEEGYTPLVLISDWLMPGIKGDEFLHEAHQRFPYVVKIILSGQADEGAVQRSKEQGSLHEFISKPWDAEHLIDCINGGLEALQASSLHASSLQASSLHTSYGARA